MRNIFVRNAARALLLLDDFKQESPIIFAHHLTSNFIVNLISAPRPTSSTPGFVLSGSSVLLTRFLPPQRAVSL